MKKSLIIPSVLGALTLAIAGCAAPPSPSGSPSASVTPIDYKACMVSDSGGFDDKSFNETAYAGLTRAKNELGVQTGEVQSKTNADYAQNIKAMLDAKCDLIVTVGFNLGTATQKAAADNPDVDFAIVDYAYDKPTANLKGLVFNTGEPSFMAGYLAASLTKTGKVGTFGGAEYPSVTAFMSGYAQGVEYYNKAKSKNVQVLGWDLKNPKGGTYIASGNFEDVAGGKQVSTNLVAQGADILLPVAGPAGEGSLQLAQASNGKVASLWVDTDGCISQEKYCSVIPSSVGKAMDVAVFETIKSAVNGEFSNEVYLGTLANGGAYLAPFHDWDSKVSTETKTELEQIKADIISGKIKIAS